MKFGHHVGVWTLALALPLAAVSATREKWDPVADKSAIVKCGQARFTVLTPRLLRLEWSADGVFEDRATLTFVNRRLGVPPFTVEPRGEGCVIDTGALRLEYAGGKFAPGTLKIGEWRFGDEDNGNLLGTARTLDGVCGFGDLMPRMGKGILSRDGWAVVDDSTNHVFTATGDEWGEWAQARADGERHDLYFFGYGHDYKAALGDYVRVAGRIALPPRWSFGYWWSRYWLYSDREVRALVDDYRSLGVPMDVMILDMDWHETWEFGEQGFDAPKDDTGCAFKGWTGYTWNRRLFPEPRRLLDYLHAHDLRVGANLHPANGIEPREDCYAAFKRDYDFDGEGTIPYRLGERKWAYVYFRDVLAPLEADGIDFWWLDWQQWATDRDIPGLSNTFWLNHLFAHHQSSLNGGTERQFIYHRWGGLGSHRYQVGFSGDSCISWDMLKAIPFFTATAANVGYGYWGHDIGGHWQPFEGAGGDGELYLRWLQSGVFTPIFKTHATKDPQIERRLWSYADKLHDLRTAVRLRYRLVPYLYTAARAAWETGVSPCRPLYYDHPEDPLAYDRTARNYLFGDDILACTIAESADPATGLAACGWYFPAGRWYDVDTGDFVEGGRSNRFERTLAENAWFVKPGAMIPMYPDSVMAVGPERGARMTLAVYPGAVTGAGSLYEDAGSTGDYDEHFAKTAFAFTTGEDGTLRLTLGPAVGTLPTLVERREWEIRFVGRLPPAAVTVDGRSAAWRYDGDELAVVVEVPGALTDREHTVEVRWSAETLAAEPRLNGLKGFVRRALALSEDYKVAESRGNNLANVADSFQTLTALGARLEAATDGFAAILDEFDAARARFPAEFTARSLAFPEKFNRRFRAQLGFAVAPKPQFVTTEIPHPHTPFGVKGDYRIRPLGKTDAKVTAGFWHDRLETNRLVTMRYNWAKCDEFWKIANFTNAAAHNLGTFKGFPFDDSHVFKMMEGTAYVLAADPGNAWARDFMEWFIPVVAKAQEPDGYLYTARTLNCSDPSLMWMGLMRFGRTCESHEIYNMGHMMEAACAWYDATGETNFLDVAIRSADYMRRNFGWERTQLRLLASHEETELALCRLYRATGDERFVDLAGFLLDQRGHLEYRTQTGYGKLHGTRNLQDHLPVVEQDEAFGHAVRVCYLGCGLMDYGVLAGRNEYCAASDNLFQNVVGKKLHLTGGVGAHPHNEEFGENYELPNDKGVTYLETCASIGLAFWCDRLFRRHGEAGYVDVLERALDNVLPASVSLTGDRFYYENPLASTGGYARVSWYDCSCCPVNLFRCLPQVPSYSWATRGSDIYFNLFLNGEAEVGGHRFAVTTDYPWHGEVALKVHPAAGAGRFNLKLRIPGWASGRPVPSDLYVQVNPASIDECSLAVNGERVELKLGADGYCDLNREWRDGDEVKLTLPMTVRRIRAHEKVEADRGRLAVERGPLVYCAEGVDNGGKAHDAILPAEATFTEEPLVIGDKTYPALRASNGLRLIPYAIWNNRDCGNELQCWFLEK